MVKMVLKGYVGRRLYKLLHNQFVSSISNCRKLFASFLTENVKFKSKQTFLSTEENPIKLHAWTFPNIP